MNTISIRQAVLSDALSVLFDGYRRDDDYFYVYTTQRQAEP